MVVNIVKSVLKRGGRTLVLGSSLMFAIILISPIILLDGYSWLRSNLGQNFVRSYIEKQAEDYGYRLDMDGFHYNLDGDIYVKHLDVYDEIGLLVRVNSVKLGVDIQALIDGELDTNFSAHDFELSNRKEASSAYLLSGVSGHVNALLDNVVAGNVGVKAMYRGGVVAANSKFSLLNGSLDLSALSVFAPDFKLSGDVSIGLEHLLARGNLSGQLDSLSFYQHLIGGGHDLEKAVFDIDLGVKDDKQNITIGAQVRSYSNKGFFVSVRDIALKAEVLGSMLRIESLNARDFEDGSFQVSGDMDVVSGLIDLSLKAKDFHAPKGDMADGVIQVDLNFKGEGEAYVLSGNIYPDKINITLPERFTQAIPEINIETPTQRKNGMPDTGLNITLDIVVDAPKQIFVRGWGLDAEFGGKVEIRGAASDPEFEGGLKLLRGRYSEFGKDFKVAKANINFSGHVPPNPKFDVLVETQMGDILLRVGISGNALKPKIKFSSVPALPEDEVLAHILFGEGMGNLSPFQAIQLAQTLQRFTGKGGGSSGFDPVGILRSTTGLDDLRFNADAAGNATIGAGKHLSDKVYLEVEAGSAEGSGSANLEIELTPNITLESEIGQDARGGAGIFWNWDY
ncbi:MAG: hypothetical protein COA45_01185 [Zetaproteobacteria bacterium]|nr:MAG: hypothetical protein COA45_01185 [Zetaproteobacteria bacterium]